MSTSKAVDITLTDEEAHWLLGLLAALRHRDEITHCDLAIAVETKIAAARLRCPPLHRGQAWRSKDGRRVFELLGSDATRAGDTRSLLSGVTNRLNPDSLYRGNYVYVAESREEVPPEVLERARRLRMPRAPDKPAATLPTGRGTPLL